MFSTVQVILMPISFGLLFLLMLLYWVQAALFSYTKYSKLTTITFFLCIISLTLLLICRFVDSGHLPLSNLYESLLFLSWSFLVIQLILQINNNSFLPVQENSYTVYNANTNTSTSDFETLSLKTNTDTFDFSSSSSLLQAQFIHFLGVVTSPMSLLTYGFAFLNLPKEMQKATSLVPALQSNWLMMHVTVMICSYAALLCGSILSMAFLFLNFCNKQNSSKRDFLPEQNSGKIIDNSKIDQVKRQNLSSAINRQEVGYVSEQNNVPLSKHSFLPELADVCKTKFYNDGFAKAPLLQPKRSFERPILAKRSFARSGTADPCKTEFCTDRKGALLKEQSSLIGNKQDLVNSLALVNSIETTFVSKLGSGLSLAEKLDNYSYRVLALGFPLLTIGILSGAVWANQAWGSYWSWDPKESWALITWLVFAVYLHARITKGWSGQKPAIIATLGFFVVWFCYLGVNLLGSGLHSYGWFSK